MTIASPSVSAFTALLVCPVCKSSMIAGEQHWHCTSCAEQFQIVDGMPILMGQAARRRVLGEIEFHDHEAEVYALAQDLRSIRVRRAHELFIERVARHLVPGSIVAELACGTGAGGALLLARGHRVIESDVSANMLRHTRDNLARQGLIEQAYLCGIEATELPFADHSIDGLIAMAAIHHLDTEQLLMLLREARRVLRPGGVVAFGFERSAFAGKVMPALYAIASRLTGMETSPEDAVFRGFTSEYLNTIFAAAGLTSARVWPVWHLSGVLHNGLRFIASARKTSQIPSIPRPLEEAIIALDLAIDRLPLVAWLCWNVDALALTPAAVRFEQ